MSDQIVPAEEATAEWVNKVFDEAYFKASIDGDGDVRIESDFISFISPDDQHRYLQYATYFGWSEGSNFIDRLNFVNRVNDELVLARAAATEKSLMLDHYLVIAGGITPRQVVTTFKTFEKVCRLALEKDEFDVLA